MAGIRFLLVVGTWLVIAGFLTRFLTRGIKSDFRRVLAGTGTFLALLALPMADEIIGGFQFRALCREGAVPEYDEAKARGRTVDMRQIPHPEVKNVMTTPSRKVFAPIPVTEKTIDWFDVSTKDVGVSYKAYSAKSGWLIRALGISNNDSPLTIDPSHCGVNSVELFKKLDIASK